MIGAVLSSSAGIARALGRALKPLLPWIAAALMGAIIWHFLPVIGPADRLARATQVTADWKAQADEQARQARNWRASYTASETLRKQETTDAIDAVASEIERCAARVTEARQSARIIERIVTKEPTYDQNRCPVRELVDPDQLRQALQPGR
ncbi:hypothetical protein [Brevundimonas sp.]|uniref:hypothetical protein n=1 Tax=Brevundimonas sp. TaxID=1871086 RepID=UPI00289634CD|nr:hypothetical protein [Brevundimonas sp.]